MNKKPVLLSLLTLLAATLSLAGRARSTSAGAHGNRPSASGAGHFHTEGELRTNSFHAVTHRDETVTGQAQVHNRSIDVRFHIEIACLDVVGNQAFMSGPTTDSNISSNVGLIGVFRVEDNGEGANDPPDRISVTRGFSPSRGVNCLNPTDPDHIFPLVPIEAGNVQVRP